MYYIKFQIDFLTSVCDSLFSKIMYTVKRYIITDNYNKRTIMLTRLKSVIKCYSLVLYLTTIILAFSNLCVIKYINNAFKSMIIRDDCSYKA